MDTKDIKGLAALAKRTTISMNSWTVLLDRDEPTLVVEAKESGLKVSSLAEIRALLDEAGFETRNGEGKIRVHPQRNWDSIAIVENFILGCQRLAFFSHWTTNEISLPNDQPHRNRFAIEAQKNGVGEDPKEVKERLHLAGYEETITETTIIYRKENLQC